MFVMVVIAMSTHCRSAGHGTESSGSDGSNSSSSQHFYSVDVLYNYDLRSIIVIKIDSNFFDFFCYFSSLSNSGDTLCLE